MDQFTMVTRPEVLKRVERGLGEVFEKFREKGLVSVYLSGSILTEDYNPETSDVDAVVFVGNSASLKDEEEINNFIADSFPEINGFKVRFIFLEEFNKGIQKGNYTKFICPQLLFHDFKYWKHVVGKKLQYRDFSFKDISNRKAVELKLEELYKRHIPDLGKNSDGQKYFLKSLARLCHFIQEEKLGKEWPFSYSGLKDRSSAEDQAVIELILEIKKRGWEKKKFEKNLSKFLDFLEKKREEIIK